MSFSSISAYLDPSNWQQQPNPQTGGGSSGNPQLLPQPPPPPPPHAGGRTGSTRPGSIIDRARMANIPMPETALKCPRCESTKTKFCYFNNYSLTQPRYFCKACRRYWTRGGAMRNVPVGGCSRRNKRSKGSSSSKSPAASSDQQTSSSTSPTNSLLGLPPHIPPPRILSRPSQLTEFDIGDSGLNYPNGVLNFQVGNSLLGGGGNNHHLVNYLSAGGEPWRLQPPPRVISSLAVSDFPAGLYPFQGGLEPSAGYGGGDQVQPKMSTSVKMEENYKELNLSGQLLGIQANDQFWSGTSTTTSAWTDLSGFISSSSTSNPTN